MAKNILIIEDDQNIAAQERQRLEKEGYTVSLANEGTTGLNRALSDHPDLIVLDIILPDTSGTSVLSELRYDPWGETVPVILLTNLSPDDQMVQAVMNNKASYYLVKAETSLDDLAEKVKSLVPVA
jgi:DNA-binding response OmpR family regulator